jgi:alanyl-tRNA synthetase
VAPDRLRFDFAHGQGLSRELIRQVEDQVNQWILDNRVVETVERPRDQAVLEGAIAFFGDKYGERVRVVTVPGASQELCGGTHCTRTGDIGLFLIAEESSVGSGSRRIEAITGPESLAMSRLWRQRDEDLARLLKTPADQAVSKVEEVLMESRQIAMRLNELEGAHQVESGRALAEGAEIHNGFRVVVARVEPATGVEGLRQRLDGMKDHVDAAVLLSGNSQQVALVVFLSQPLIDFGMDASRLVKAWAPIIGGGGGGRADFAQAGGKRGADSEKLLAMVRSELQTRLKSVPSTVGRG